MRSCTRATTQSTLPSRFGSAHTSQTACPARISATLPQRSHGPSSSRNVTSSSPSSRASASSDVSSQRTKRCAVFSPTPGRRESSFVSRRTFALTGATRLHEPRDLHAAGDLLELGLHLLVGLLDRLIDGGADPVEHEVDGLAPQRVLVDLDVLQAPPKGDHDLHLTAQAFGCKLPILQLILRLIDLALHPRSLAHQLVHPAAKLHAAAIPYPSSLGSLTSSSRAPKTRSASWT